MTSPTDTRLDPRAKIERIDDRLREGSSLEALALAAQFTREYPDNIDGWILLGRACVSERDYARALNAGERAVAIDARNPAARLLLTEGLLRKGRTEEASKVIAGLETERKFDPAVMHELGWAYARMNKHADAARCYERVRILQPTNRPVVHNLCGAYIALGEMEKAEALYDEVLRKDAREVDAYYNRAALRIQTPERNHISAMEKALEGADQNAEIVLCYALAKELEDLKEWKRSFAYLKRGADSYRRMSPYRVETDLDLMKEISRQFDESFFAENTSGYAEESPIFVLGMPRSGTTLVDRIVSSHSTVASVGESDEISHLLIRRTSKNGPQDKITIEHMRRARQIEWASAGREYCDAIRGLMPGNRRLLDKTPRNFFYLGAILAALPNAKVLHLRRRPMDSCYAIYKVLFRQGFPFSYDLRDTGRFYLGYLELMEHWRKVLPGRFLDIDYEELVDNQEAVTRRMLEFCGLEWEDGCLSFEKNASPAATASAAQVRRPIYKSSVALWRRYEEELEPLARVLRDGGIEIA
jgi:tetratricopeptide (TPR) repeat protein